MIVPGCHLFQCVLVLCVFDRKSCVFPEMEKRKNSAEYTILGFSDRKKLQTETYTGVSE